MTSQSRRGAVAVIGLGLLGTPIAKHLTAAGYDVIGCDIDPERRSIAGELGVAVADDAAAAARDAPVLITALPTVEALDRVCHDLIAAAPGEPRTVVEVSTLPVDRKRAAAARLADVDTTLLDCPVLGTSAQAHAGELVMCVSGPAATARAVEPILAAFTLRREYLGELGTGTTMKLIANLLVGVHTAAAAEALTLARRAGIEPRTALRVLAGSAGGSRQLELRGPMMVEDTYEPPAATSSVFLKDLALISELAESVQSPIQLLAAAHELFVASMEMGNADLDLSSVHRVLEARAGTDTDRGSDAR